MKEHLEEKQWKCIFIRNQWRNQAQYLLLITNTFKCRLESFIKIGLQVFQHTHNTLGYREAWLGKSLYHVDSEKEKAGNFQSVFLYQVSLKGSISSKSILSLASILTLSYLTYQCRKFIFGKISAGFVLLNSHYCEDCCTYFFISSPNFFLDICATENDCCLKNWRRLCLLLGCQSPKVFLKRLVKC